MSEPREQQEPSMEEILSSIRRIIADEEADEGKAEADAAEAETEDEGAAEEDDEEDVLELTEVVRDGGEVVDLKSGEADEEPSGEAAAPEPAADEAPEPEEVAFARMPETPETQAETNQTNQEDETVVETKQAGADELVSDAAASVATGAFAKLSHAFQRTPSEESVAEGGGRTVEQFVEDMIRPMLRSWMDENLPPIVEKLVEKEIQKIARRAELL